MRTFQQLPWQHPVRYTMTLRTVLHRALSGSGILDGAVDNTPFKFAFGEIGKKKGEAYQGE